MEKFSQFRDRGSGISPFIPVSTPTSTPNLLLHFALFLFRLPIFLTYTLTYFLILNNFLPLFPLAFRKLLLWGMLGIPWIWWNDLQIDGIKRGSLATANNASQRMPHPGSVIAASFTSPVDALYLAATFDPIFTVSYPESRKVRRVSLLGAIMQALSPAQLVERDEVGGTDGLTDVRALLEAHPNRCIAVFPECATTNGKGILPFAPSLLSVPADVRIFPVSIRYAAPDITTPVPGAWTSFLWNLLSRPTHSIRVRIAEPVYNDVAAAANGNGVGDVDEMRTLDRVGEALARLGRNKRVGLRLKDKAAFVKAWTNRKR